MTVRGELVLLARDRAQDRGYVQLVLGAPGFSESALANSSNWPLSMTDSKSRTPGPFELTDLPTGTLELTFIDGMSARVLGARTVNGAAGETVDLGRVELTLP